METKRSKKQIQIIPPRYNVGQVIYFLNNGAIVSARIATSKTTETGTCYLLEEWMGWQPEYVLFVSFEDVKQIYLNGK